MTKTICDLLHDGQTRHYTYSLSLLTEPDGDGEHEINRNIVDITEWKLSPETLKKDLAAIQEIYPGMASGWYSLTVTRTDQYVGEFCPSVEILFFAGDYCSWKQVPASVIRHIRIKQYTRCLSWRRLHDNSLTVTEYFSAGESFKIQFPDFLIDFFAEINDDIRNA